MEALQQEYDALQEKRMNGTISQAEASRQLELAEQLSQQQPVQEYHTIGRRLGSDPDDNDL
jgi:hypothetical protein